MEIDERLSEGDGLAIAADGSDGAQLCLMGEEVESIGIVLRIVARGDHDALSYTPIDRLQERHTRGTCRCSGAQLRPRHFAILSMEVRCSSRLDAEHLQRIARQVEERGEWRGRHGDPPWCPCH